MSTRLQFLGLGIAVAIGLTACGSSAAIPSVPVIPAQVEAKMQAAIPGVNVKCPDVLPNFKVGSTFTCVASASIDGYTVHKNFIVTENGSNGGGTFTWQQDDTTK